MAPSPTCPREAIRGFWPRVRQCEHSGTTACWASPSPRTTATSGRIYVTYDKGAASSAGSGWWWSGSRRRRWPSTSFRFADRSRRRNRCPQLAQVNRTHGIDAVLVPPDASLFVSVGDDALNNGDPKTFRAQDLDQPARQAPTHDARGLGRSLQPLLQPGNPRWLATHGLCLWPQKFFRFSLDPRSGMPIVGDVGWLTHEEINTLPPGADAGWPCFEGLSFPRRSGSQHVKGLSSARSARCRSGPTRTPGRVRLWWAVCSTPEARIPGSTKAPTFRRLRPPTTMDARTERRRKADPGSETDGSPGMQAAR